jgi:predicted aspartyl protease
LERRRLESDVSKTDYLLALVLACAVTGYGGPVCGQGTIFKWTDSNGIVHFSDSNVPREYAGNVEERQQRRIRVATGQPENEATSIPLLAREGRKYVNATLEGRYQSKKIMMLVDTGAQMSMIDEDLAGDLDLEFISEAGIVGVTGTAPGWVGRVQRLKLDGKELSDWPILVGPSRGLALLGTDVLDHLELSVGSKSLDGK